MTHTTAAEKVKEIYWNIIQHWCGGPAEYDDPIVSKRFNEWLASSSGSRLVGELGEGWVSVETKLPNKNEEYIVCGKGFEGRIITTMEWKNKKWFSDVYQKYIEQIKITHWQPLPEPPKIN